jgi:hypothetical protein
MPKDSHLLPQHSQELLRAARSGRIYKRPTPAEDEEAETLELGLAEKTEKAEKKEEEIEEKGFAAKTWKLLPRHLEGPDTEYLAKRRKGLITPTTSVTVVPGAPVTKATVRRTDAAGNTYVEDLVLKAGDQVTDGEVIAQTTIAPSGGDSGAQTPVKRRPPPPKRKAKGPGRGRKKKVVILEGEGANPVAGATQDDGNGATIGPDVSIPYPSTVLLS